MASAARVSPLFHLSIIGEETRWLDRAADDDE
jgi:hypothetical protein